MFCLLLYILKVDRVPTAVRTMLRLTFPPKISDQTLDAPPPGLIPVKNKPNCIETVSGNMSLA